MNTKRKQSDSSVQRSIEILLFEKTKEALEIDNLDANHAVRLKSDPNIVIRPDIYSEKERIIGEIHTHLGKLKPAQLHKVAADVLKMLVFEEDYGEPFRKILVICSKEEESQLKGQSFVAHVIREYNIDILCYDELASEDMKALENAMKEQNLMESE